MYYGRHEDRPSGEVMATYEGVEIHYNPGRERFEAMIGRKVVRRQTIQALRKEIGARTAHRVELMTGSGTKVVVTGKTSEGKWRREDGEIIRAYLPLYAWDAELSRQFEQLHAAQKEFRDAVSKRDTELHRRLVEVREMPPKPEPEPEPVIDTSQPIRAQRRVRR